MESKFVKDFHEKRTCSQTNGYVHVEKHRSWVRGESAYGDGKISEIEGFFILNDSYKHSLNHITRKSSKSKQYL